MSRRLDRAPGESAAIPAQRICVDSALYAGAALPGPRRVQLDCLTVGLEFMGF